MCLRFADYVEGDVLGYRFLYDIAEHRRHPDQDRADTAHYRDSRSITPSCTRLGAAHIDLIEDMKIEGRASRRMTLVLVSPKSHLAAAAKIQLAQQVMNVAFGRGQLYVQLPRDFLVAQSYADQADKLPLARRKGRSRLRAAPTDAEIHRAGNPADQAGRHAARADLFTPHDVDEQSDEVAEGCGRRYVARRTRLRPGDDVFFAFWHRENNNPSLRADCPDSPDRAGAIRKSRVEQDHGGLAFVG